MYSKLPVFSQLIRHACYVDDDVVTWNNKSMRIYVVQARLKSRRGPWIQDPTARAYLQCIALPPIIGTENTDMMTYMTEQRAYASRFGR
jgi:hypothetical protein